MSPAFQVPLSPASVDVAVFCLSLMGTNLVDFLTEAHRVLKLGYRLSHYLFFFNLIVFICTTGNTK